jgi:hypothetical protein
MSTPLKSVTFLKIYHQQNHLKYISISLKSIIISIIEIPHKKTIIELDDGKILTGKPDQFDGKPMGFRLRFPLNQSSEI